MTRNDIKNEYFEWLYNLVHIDRGFDDIGFRKLLMHLHGVEFIFHLPMDENRALDGISLRWRYICERDYSPDVLDDLEGPCSVLEMMIALAFKCDEFMDDPAIGDRFAQWFWHMIVSLGLGSMDDRTYNRRAVERSVRGFLDRAYNPDGSGGLFTIKNCNHDLRRVEIWHQMCWYLDKYY